MSVSPVCHNGIVSSSQSAASADRAGFKTSIAAYDQKSREFSIEYEAISPSTYWAWLELSLRAESCVLDLGCGSGRDAAHFANRHEVVGVDVSSGMLGEALRLHPELNLVQADGRDLPFSRGAFDAVWAMASLVHLDRRGLEEALHECARVIRPGGVLFVSLPISEASAWRSSNGVPRWFAYLPPDEVLSELARAGFVTRDVERAPGVAAGEWLNVLAEAASVAHP